MPSRSNPKSASSRPATKRSDQNRRPPTARTDDALPTAADPANHLPKILAILAIVMLGIIAYANSFQGAFLFDDVLNITQRSWFYADNAIDIIWTKSDRPLTDITFVYNIRAQDIPPGQPPDPLGFHVVNLVIHIVGALLLFSIVRRTLLLPTFSGRFRNTSLAIALAISAIWIVHPLQTQAVTYIVQRAESLMAMFYLLTLYCYIRGATGQTMHWWMWFGGSVLACALGMASKPIMVTAPVLVLLYDFCFLRGVAKDRLQVRILTMLALAATWTVLFRVGIAQDVLDTDRQKTVAGLGFQTEQAGQRTWLYYFLTQPAVLLHYLRLSVWPSPLILDYKWPLVSAPAQAIIPLTVVTLAGLATVWALVKRPAVGFVAAAFFIILAPTSSFIPIKDVAFEHRMYLPLAAVITLLVLGCFWLLGRLWTATNAAPRARILSAAVPLALVVAVFTVATHTRNRDYHDPEQMWRTVIANAPFGAQPRALNNLATKLIDKSKLPEFADRKIDLDREACELFAQIIDLQPESYELPLEVVYYNHANCLRRQGDRLGAIEYYRLSVEENPRWLRSYIMWGNTLSDMRDVRNAVEQYNKAIDIGSSIKKPGNEIFVARASFNLGNQYLALGRHDDAFDAYFSAGNYYPPAYSKGFMSAARVAERNLKDEQRAILAYSQMLRYVPNHPQATAALQRLQQTPSAP